jgi:hypothetical protein
MKIAGFEGAMQTTRKKCNILESVQNDPRKASCLVMWPCHRVLLTILCFISLSV